MYCPANKKVYISADVKFMGRQFYCDAPVPKVNHINPQGVDGGADSDDDEPEVCIASAAVKVAKQGKDQPDVVTDTWEQHEQTVLAAAVRATDVFEPKTYKQAIGSADAAQWRESIRREVEAMSRHNVFKVIKIADLPAGANIISSRWIFKVKCTGDGTLSSRKSHIVARGYEGKKGVDYTRTYSPVAGVTTVRMVVAVAAVLGLHMWQGDANEAFLNSDTTEVTEGVRIFVKPPEGCGCPQGCVWELLKMLYGLKSAPLA